MNEDRVCADFLEQIFWGRFLVDRSTCFFGRRTLKLLPTDPWVRKAGARVA